MQFQAFQQQRGIRADQGQLALDPFRT
jgi:hypothetical protein